MIARFHRMSADTDIAVIGAGIGGLTLGLALRRHGIRVQIFEQAPELAEVGAAVALAANGTRILRELGLGAELEDASRRSRPNSCTGTGRTRPGWSPIPSAGGTRNGSARPSGASTGPDLQAALAGAWGTDDLHLGKTLVGMRARDDGTELAFADGTTVTAGLVVGADGIRSRVRTWITDTVPVYSGTSGFRGLVPRSAVPDLPDPGRGPVLDGPGRPPAALRGRRRDQLPRGRRRTGRVGVRTRPWSLPPTASWPRRSATGTPRRGR